MLLPVLNVVALNKCFAFTSNVLKKLPSQHLATNLRPQTRFLGKNNSQFLKCKFNKILPNAHLKEAISFQDREYLVNNIKLLLPMSI